MSLTEELKCVRVCVIAVLTTAIWAQLSFYIDSDVGGFALLALIAFRNVKECFLVSIAVRLWNNALCFLTGCGGRI